MKLPHDKFCVLPWISIEASPTGTVRPCCLARHELTDGFGNTFNLNQHDLDAVIGSKELWNLRGEFLEGKQPEMCSRCWAEEDSGRTSKRMHTLKRLENILHDEEEWTQYGKDLMFIDLKLGNVCNLKCRICGSWSSSTFAAEELKQMPLDQRKDSWHKQMITMGTWPRKNTNFWDRLKEHAHTIKYLEFTGGEPFMIKEHFEFLQMLIDLHVAHQIEIHYNTNGTIYPEEAEHIWLHFKHVEIAFSIDAVGDKFEYQRTNAKWDEVTNNIEKFKLLRNDFNNISLQVCTTINVYNVMYLDEVAEWIDKQNFNFVYWNMLHDGPENCITSLPSVAKDITYSRLVNSESNHKQEFQRVADFMMNSDGVPHEKLLKHIARLDKRREHNLATAHPELASAIGYN